MDIISGNRVVVSVIGKDSIGIIAGISDVVSACKGNVEQISQTILDGFFSMIMIVSLEDCDVDLPTLREKLVDRGNSLGVRVMVQHEDIFKSMHRI
jgi:ACT domain-containing protein